MSVHSGGTGRASSGIWRSKKNAVVYMSEWDIFGEELNTRLGAPIPNYAPPAHWSRKDTRSMGKVAMLGVDAAGEALADAGLLGTNLKIIKQY